MSGYYETERALGEYLLLHYGEPPLVLPYPFGPAGSLHFPVRCVSECLDRRHLPAGARALDLGCAVGRASFELARHCAHVIGLDDSTCFIQAASRLQREGMVSFTYVEEGDLEAKAIARVPPDIDRGRVIFGPGDAQHLWPELGSFDVVLLANVLDRLREPRRCLAQLPMLVKPGGQLILSSPYTWLEEYTPKENWLGGFERDGRPVRTFDTLQTLLGPDFDLLARKDLPLLLREHARKYQWIVAESTLWARK